MEKALSLAYRFLAFRPRTIFEVNTYLQKKREKYAITQEEIISAIELLKDQGYLDDLAFINSFVRSRNTLKPKSQHALTLELKKMGVSQGDIQTYFVQHPLDEDGLAHIALRKKVKMLMHITDERKRFVKAVAFLQRRGFSFDTAKRAYLQVVRV